MKLFWVEAFPEVACYTRELLGTYLRFATREEILREENALIEKMVEAEIIGAEQTYKTENLDRAWIFIQCYLTVREKALGNRRESSNLFRKIFPYVCIRANEMFCKYLESKQLASPQTYEWRP